LSFRFSRKQPEECSDTNGFFHGHRNITDAEFDGIKERMYAQVPPYFFSIVNTVRFHKQFDKVFICFDAFKIFRNTGARKFVKYLGAKRFISGASSFPERRVGTEGINMREKIAGGIGYMLAISRLSIPTCMQSKIRLLRAASCNSFTISLPGMVAMSWLSQWLNGVPEAPQSPWLAQSAKWFCAAWNIWYASVISADISAYFHHSLVHFRFYLVADHFLSLYDNLLLMALEFRLRDQ
jgi:hypothetical protein